ncbi:unnamed protein product [Haemonchus placei]|uniref:SCP domain-containing protein n=1 Tax=Haemonchus placei TaxID=6290 RepID=A0A0N4WGF0_HAEPC|nr:unnamed protein product [Haemonchus placei]
MLLTFSVLAFFLANVASDDALLEDVKAAFEELNPYGGKIAWSDELEKKALEYLKSPDSVKADLVIKGKKTFPKDDRTSLGMKVYKAFLENFEKKDANLRNLRRGSQYGCNIIFKTTSMKQDVLNGVCLFRKQ